MTTTITISESLKEGLKDIRDEHEELSSLNATIQFVLDNPSGVSHRVGGTTENLTKPVKVTEETQTRVKSVRDREGYADYEAVLRDRIGASARKTGEEPVDIEPLDDG